MRTHNANNQLLQHEGAGAIWFCDRLPCRGQVHGPGHAGEHEALLPRRANLPDGGWDFDVSDLEKEYDLIVLRVSELSSETMRKLVSGSCRAKLAAMWEGPFEYYVWLDSDAIVWGDFTPQIRTDVDFQIFWSEISIPADATEIPPWLPHFYFDPQKLSV